MREGVDGQVLPSHDGVQISASCAEPASSVDVPVELCEALLPVAVHVIGQVVASLLRTLEESTEQRVCRRTAFKDEWAAAAAPQVSTCEAGFHSLEVRQAMRVIPRLHALVCCPPLVVERVAALKNHPVDAARTAQHLASCVEDAPVVHVWFGIGLVAPVVQATTNGERQRSRHVNERVENEVGATCFEDEDRDAGVGAEPVREG